MDSKRPGAVVTRTSHACFVLPSKVDLSLNPLHSLPHNSGWNEYRSIRHLIHDHFELIITHFGSLAGLDTHVWVL